MKTNDFIKKILVGWPSKLCCMLFAVWLVFIVRFSSYSTTESNIALQVKLPQGYEAMNKIDSYATLTIQGDRKVIYLIDPSQITAVADFTNVDQPNLEDAVQSGTPLVAAVDLVYRQGIVRLEDEIILTSNPSSIRVLLRKTE